VTPDLKALRADIHSCVLELRSIELIINSTAFQYVWEHTDEFERGVILSLIHCKDSHTLRHRISNHACLDLGEKPLRILRAMASKLDIVNYSRVSRSALILAIEKAKKNG
jgi:hypothetical protein